MNPTNQLNSEQDINISKNNPQTKCFEQTLLEYQSQVNNALIDLFLPHKEEGDNV